MGHPKDPFRLTNVVFGGASRGRRVPERLGDSFSMIACILPKPDGLIAPLIRRARTDAQAVLTRIT